MDSDKPRTKNNTINKPVTLSSYNSNTAVSLKDQLSYFVLLINQFVAFPSPSDTQITRLPVMKLIISALSKEKLPLSNPYSLSNSSSPFLDQKPTPDISQNHT